VPLNRTAFNRRRDQPRTEAAVTVRVLGREGTLRVRTRLLVESDTRITETYEEAEFAGKAIVLEPCYVGQVHMHELSLMLVMKNLNEFVETAMFKRHQQHFAAGCVCGEQLQLTPPQSTCCILDSRYRSANTDTSTAAA
jgi:hypothetical protein